MRVKLDKYEGNGVKVAVGEREYIVKGTVTGQVYLIKDARKNV